MSEVEIHIRCLYGEDDVPYVGASAEPADETLAEQVWLEEGVTSAAIVVHHAGGRDVFCIERPDGPDGVESWQLQHQVKTTGFLAVTMSSTMVIARGPITGIDSFTSWPPTEDELRDYILGLADGLTGSDLLEVYELARSRSRRVLASQERAA